MIYKLIFYPTFKEIYLPRLFCVVLLSKFKILRGFEHSCHNLLDKNFNFNFNFLYLVSIICTALLLCH